jgi:hypothetical protein
MSSRWNKLFFGSHSTGDDVGDKRGVTKLSFTDSVVISALEVKLG